MNLQDALSSGIQAILNLADRPYDEDTIKFQIAPILNAAGRLYNAGSSSVLKALLSEDDTQSLVFASKMKQINEERKRLVTHWLTIAAAAAEEQSATSDEINRSIEQINTISAETSSAMAQSAAAVTELAKQAQELKKLIAQMVS
mgnify:CR=1 FL=1